MAAHIMFKKHGVGYEMADENVTLDNQIVFIRGGGNLVKYYNHTADFIKQRCARVKQLIILPQTISGHEDVISKFDSRVTIFCREQVSYDYVKSYRNISKVFLTDDMAFDINVKECFPKLAPFHRFIYATKLRRLLSEVLKGKSSLRDYLQKRDGGTLFAFRTDAERTATELPEKNVDVSQVINFDPTMGNVNLAYKTSKTIFRVVNQFKTIHTNRLHVCIAAILLKKQVFFYGNAYHKNKSVYIFSMNERFNNVTWMD